MHYPHWPKFVAKNINNNRLELLTKALKLLKTPQSKIHNVIHVTGTNGKGSTANFIANILIKSGFKANLFTSPHLIHYNECFIINGEKIPDSSLYEIIEVTRDKLGNDFNLTLFEASFIFALISFQKYPADFNIFETGLGGRIDPTILLENKIFNVLTPISLDHQEFLGPNIESITCEKAYTICPNSKTIISPQTNLALGILKQFSISAQAEYLCYLEDYDFFAEDNIFSYVDLKTKTIYEFETPTLRGKHQLINLATSLSCIKEIIDLNKYHTEINEGIISTKFHNRLEKMHHPKLLEKEYAGCEIWCDGAHNKSGAQAVSKWLAEQEEKFTFVIYGRTAKKDHLEFLSEFSKTADKIIFFEVANEAMPCRKSEFLEAISCSELNKKTSLENDLESAILYCFEQQKERPFRAIILGSLYAFRDYKNFFN